MMMTRENMMDEVIKTRGFEDKMTIWFCGLYEDATMTDSMLYNAMVVALSYVEPEEEDEEQNPSPFFIAAKLNRPAAHVPYARFFHYTRSLNICQEKSCTNFIVL